MERARSVAALLASSLHNSMLALPQSSGLVLAYTSEHVELRYHLGSEKLKPIMVDFLRGPMGYRFRQGFTTGHEMLIRALGVKKNQVLTIFDACAGLGQDSMVMLLAGHRVFAFERSLPVFELLSDGLKRFFAIRPELEAKMTLTLANSIAELQTHPTTPDVVYLDPMYPDLEKTALQKKEMRIFRQLVGEDLDADLLFEVAWHKATLRVVVKRPLSAPPLREGVSHSLRGRAARFDVYVK